MLIDTAVTKSLSFRGTAVPPPEVPTPRQRHMYSTDASRDKDPMFNGYLNWKSPTKNTFFSIDPKESLEFNEATEPMDDLRVSLP
jgi:hypothetical protein